MIRWKVAEAWSGLVVDSVSGGVKRLLAAAVSKVSSANGGFAFTCWMVGAL